MKVLLIAIKLRHLFKAYIKLELIKAQDISYEQAVINARKIEGLLQYNKAITSQFQLPKFRLAILKPSLIEVLITNPSIVGHPSIVVHPTIDLEPCIGQMNINQILGLKCDQNITIDHFPGKDHIESDSEEVLERMVVEVPDN